MNAVDAVGSYRATITGHTIGLTSKKSLPQAIIQTKITARYIDTDDLIKHFELEGPGWVDYTAYEQVDTAYLVLFTDPEEFTVEGDDRTALFHYDDLQRAIGWNGTSFDDLGDGKSFLGKEVVLRFEENEYQDKITIRANGIDSGDADPYRGLRTLDSAEIKDLNKKLKGIKSKSTPKPAATAAKPAATPALTAKAPAAPAPAAVAEALPAELDKGAAWSFVCENKGDNSDKDVSDAWVAACTEVSTAVAKGDPAKTEAKFTNTDWAAVRDAVISDLDLNV